MLGGILTLWQYCVQRIAALTSEQVVATHESELEHAPVPSGGDLSESLREIRDAYDQLSMNTDSPVIDVYKKRVKIGVMLYRTWEQTILAF